MRKMRHKKHFIHENLTEKFEWIRVVKAIGNFIPSSDETYFIDFKGSIKTYDYQYHKSRREVFEEFVSDFFEVEKGRNQVIFCWRETGVILIVFNTTN